MKKWTPFRNWVHNFWVENCEEHLGFNEKPYNEREYFSKYKYWLKREYQHQQKVKNA